MGPGPSFVRLLLVASLATTACAGGKQSATITADGSSTVFPFTQAVAEAFAATAPGVRVSVGISGTSGGFRQFCSGATDVQDASRPITLAEAEACAAAGVDYIELPIAYDGIVVAVNPQNTWARSITIAELRTLWAPEAQGVITRWSQIRPEWPDVPLRLYGPGPDSGTFDTFTEAVVGRVRASRSDYVASEDDDALVQGVASDVGALGYFGLAYYHANEGRLALLAVDGGAGPVLPTPEAVAANTYTPLSRPLFVYVSKRALARPEVALFATFLIARAPATVAEVGYVPLPDEAYALGHVRIAQRRVGSLFLAGRDAQLGLSIEQLLERSEAN